MLQNGHWRSLVPANAVSRESRLPRANAVSNGGTNCHGSRIIHDTENILSNHEVAKIDLGAH